jgi:hypothetical protein
MVELEGLRRHCEKKLSHSEKLFGNICFDAGETLDTGMAAQIFELGC